MDALRPWGNLHIDLLAGIFRHLPCLGDRVRAAAACRTWRQGMLMPMNPKPDQEPEPEPEPRLPHPPQLPWLLVPYESAAALPPHTTRRASFFCFLCNRTHHFTVPHCTGGARFFGAYRGGWLFLAYGQSCGHGLINLHDHQSIVLPDGISAWYAGYGGLVPAALPMFIRAATLSAPPGSLEGSVAAAIITVLAPDSFGPPFITFWRMGSRLASCTMTINAEDVIYHNGAFHFLAHEGNNLLLCTPQFQNGAPVDQLTVWPENRIIRGGVRMPNTGARYLVECRGELLMVLRVQPRREVTSSFRVFRMRQDQAPNANRARYRWTELHALDGRMLFVGRGCSRSFEAARYPGTEEGVYFLDDGNFHAAPVIRYGDGTWQWHYGCSDNGIWPGAPPDYYGRRLFPRRHPSTYSSPVWFFLD